MNFFRLALAGIVSIVFSNHAFAWGATAVGDGNVHFTYYDAPTAQEAEQRALVGCANKTANCRLATKRAVRSTAMMMAVGDGGWAQAADPNPDEAAKDALASCKKITNGCRIESAIWDSTPYWGAMAVGDDFLFIKTGAETQEEAERTAVERCQSASATKSGCAARRDFSTSAHVYYAVAKGAGSTGFAFNSSAEKAKAEALKYCEDGKKDSKPCLVKQTFESVGAPAAPTSMRRWIAEAEKASKPRRAKPAVVATTASRNIVRCTNRCTNGSCVRTFENGRTERWQAPRVYDPFTQNWKWDTDTNACGV
ncbi:DUF4189 domain-containing protein [Ralstonia insidiosa]|uniref:DUF4189 domain-containing protein n=1 Tax=Ralstonia insidiosa TaxID=190721 RepID=A0A848P9E4_9RALS|nr:DUF4189 domain-containing protein [Ralstonia insidiosa]NMV41955.1 DUF4189 domain-containing protein [Ralstonia insidiosa]